MPILGSDYIFKCTNSSTGAGAECVTLSAIIAAMGLLASNGDGSLLTGLTKTQVGLANVDNTSDANKPVSTATQTALNLKANLASPTFTGTVVFPSGQALVAPVLGTPASGNLANCTFPALNQNTTGSAASLSISGQTGLLTFTGITSTNRIKTVRDAADTILELGGSYTPTGTWTSMILATPNIGAATGTSAALTGAITSSGTAGIGYATGAGANITQTTNRTTGVTINKICGTITLVSAAGSTTFASFTVTNSTVAATDSIIVVQKSGTDLYEIHVTAVAAGSFRVTYRTTAGTTTEQPVFNFAVIKGVAA